MFSGTLLVGRSNYDTDIVNFNIAVVACAATIASADNVALQRRTSDISLH